MDKLIEEKTQAINEQNFEKAASLRDQIKEAREEIEKENKENKIDLKIGFDQIAKIVSDWSKVPITKLTEDEKQKYMDLDIDLKKEVIGQDKAIDAISHAIKRSRVGLKDPKNQ